MAKRKRNQGWGILSCVIGFGRLVVQLIDLFSELD